MSIRRVDIQQPAHAPLVCVIDPDAGVRRNVATLLHAIGVEVESFSTAREFLAALPRAVPMCVVAESALPDMSGIALLQELRARGLGIPTILMSRDADVSGAVQAMRAGARDFIEKPFLDRTLVTQVAAILDLDGRRPH